MEKAKKMKYAGVEDVLHILKRIGEDYKKLKPGALYHGNGGKEVKLTRSGLVKTIQILEQAGVQCVPSLSAARDLVSMEHWKKAGGSGKKAVDYRGMEKKAAISAIGNINLRVGGNKNGKGGFFTDRKTGDSVKVAYSEDGKTITITR